MKRIVTSIAALLLLSTAALAGELVKVSGASKVALDGYDPVAFFTESKPVNGSPGITGEHRGATYFFANEEHKKLFKENPDKYAPQYGGFCAFGVAKGALFPVDINTWQVRDGKLYLNLNPEVLRQFNAHIEQDIAKAEKNWPHLVKKNGR